MPQLTLEEGIAVVKTVAEKQQTDIKQFLMTAMSGILGAFIISVLFLAAFSILMTAKDMPSTAVMPFACISISAGAMGGGVVSSRLYRSRGLMIGAVTGLLFYIILYIVGIIMRQADLNAMFLLKIFLSIIFGAIGGIIGINMKTKRSRF
jgi:putative membrane protein (TIGR04086 family)